MTGELDLHTVRIVRAVAEHGSITGAAEVLGYSQPALSQHLRRAERRLGIPLLIRAGRGVRLTEAGRAVARHSSSILGALAVAEEEIGHLADLTTGTVRLAGFPSSSSTVVPLLMARIAAAHPGLRLHYVEAEPPESLAMLADGSIDIALTFAYPGDPADPHDAVNGIQVIELFTDPVQLVLPKGHPLGEVPVVRLDAVEAAEWISGCPLCRGHLLAACGALGFSPRITHATDNSVAVLGLVAAGVGIALQPRLALEPLPALAGTTVHSVLPASDRSVRAVHLAGSSGVAAIEASLAALIEVTAPRRASAPLPTRVPASAVSSRL